MVYLFFNSELQMSKAFIPKPRNSMEFVQRFSSNSIIHSFFLLQILDVVDMCHLRRPVRIVYRPCLIKLEKLRRIWPGRRRVIKILAGSLD